MNEIFKKDLPDIGKVFGVNITALLVANQTIIDTNQIFQEIGGTIAIYMGIIYTCAKLYKLISNIIQNREHRRNEHKKLNKDD